MITQNDAPRLKNKEVWTSEFQDFSRACLTKDCLNRPNCDVLLKHDFIQKRETIDLRKELYEGRSTEFNLSNNVILMDWFLERYPNLHFKGRKRLWTKNPCLLVASVLEKHSLWDNVIDSLDCSLPVRKKLSNEDESWTFYPEGIGEDAYSADEYSEEEEEENIYEKHCALYTFRRISSPPVHVKKCWMFWRKHTHRFFDREFRERVFTALLCLRRKLKGKDLIGLILIDTFGTFTNTLTEPF